MSIILGPQLGLLLHTTAQYACIAELSFKTIEHNLVEAIHSMETNHFQIIRQYPYPPVPLTSIITGFTIIVISLISATLLAGYLDGGSLGILAISYSYQRYTIPH